jgi:peroxiredoxin
MRYLYVLLLFMMVSLSSKGQKLKSEEIEVRDSSAVLYPTERWQKLVFSGKYTVHIQPDGKKATLIRLPPEEAERRLSKMSKPLETTNFITGSTIQSFTERDINGNRFDLKALRGKIVVLNFWFINCGPCRQEIPELNELVDSFSKKDVVFLGIALDGRSDLYEFLKTYPFRYAIIPDGRSVADQYGIGSYPTHVILDTNGKVVFHTVGFTMNTIAWMENIIRSLVRKSPGNS